MWVRKRVILCLYVHLKFGVGCKRSTEGHRVFLSFSESNFLPRTQIAGIFREDNVWYVCVFVCLYQTEREDDDWYERERERR